MKEFLLSILSGVVVAIIVALIAPGGRGATHPQTQSREPDVPRRGSITGTLLRFLIAAAGGVGIAYAAAHQRIAHTSILLLAVAGTILVWLLLSALLRR